MAAAADRTPEEQAVESLEEREFEQLRRWRWERAEGKPAYTVAANAVLEEALRRRPRDLEQLLQIRGIGPVFCERHGESLLAALTRLDASTAATQADDPIVGVDSCARRPAA